MDHAAGERQPLLSGAPRAHYEAPSQRTSSTPAPPFPEPKPSIMRITTPWLALAAASGACAAFNGVFAKLTTTELTSSFAGAMSSALGLAATSRTVEVLIRATFFSLNLAFNALMWALFTAALTRASSTTRVSIINTSSNFMFTAFLGWVIFKESLPPLWWVGAAGLVVGNVIIGRREEGEVVAGEEGRGERDGEGEHEREREGYRDHEEEEEDGKGEEIEMEGEEVGKGDGEGVKGGVVREREVGG